MDLTNWPKGRKQIKMKLEKKSSCEDQGNKKMKKQERNTDKGKSGKVIPLCNSTRTGVQGSHTELCS
jgi:hypothetical protein